MGEKREKSERKNESKIESFEFRLRDLVLLEENGRQNDRKEKY